MKQQAMTMRGGKELEELMVKHLPAAVARRALLAGLKASAKPMMEYARQTAPFDSGALRQSIWMKSIPPSQVQKQGATWTAKFTGMKDPPVAAIQLAPMTGTGARPMSAWAMYMSHHKRKIDLKKGNPIGHIRHAHLMEFGYTRRGKTYPGRHYMERAAEAMYSTFVSGFVGETRKKVEAAIKRHNARSPVRVGKK